MTRRDLTRIIWGWHANLLTRQEYRLALLYAVQGRGDDAVEAALRRIKELGDAGVFTPTKDYRYVAATWGGETWGGR